MLRVSKKERVFFEHFVDMLGKAYECSSILENLMSRHDDMNDKIAKIAEINDTCVTEMHKLLKILNDSFITPIDREDIYRIAKKIRSIISHILEAAYGAAIYNIGKERPQALQLMGYINKIVYHQQELMKNFIKMRMDKETLAELEEINSLTKTAEEIYRNEMSNLFAHEKNAVAIIKWNRMFILLEKILEKSADLTDIVEGVIIKDA